MGLFKSQYNCDVSLQKCDPIVLYSGRNQRRLSLFTASPNSAVSTLTSIDLLHIIPIDASESRIRRKKQTCWQLIASTCKQEHTWSRRLYNTISIHS